MIAKQFYIFHSEIPLNGETEIALPDDEDIVIFAVTVAVPCFFAFNVTYSIFAYFIDDVDRSMLLFTANPEIAGIKTNQLPTSIYGNPVEYKFDKEGYISEIEIKATGGSLVYTLTWK